MTPDVRPPPVIVRDLPAVRTAHEETLAQARSGTASRAVLTVLARAEAEIAVFDRSCIGHVPHCLMATGLVWDDVLRHPLAPGLEARVRLGDRVEVEGEEIGIAEATALVARRAGRGAAIADWHRGPLRLGAALGLEHPPRPVEASTAQYGLL